MPKFTVIFEKDFTELFGVQVKNAERLCYLLYLS
jgi:hypothetical protein